MFRNYNRLLIFLIKIQLFDLSLYIFPSTVQCMPLPFSTHPDCLLHLAYLSNVLHKMESLDPCTIYIAFVWCVICFLVINSVYLLLWTYIHCPVPSRLDCQLPKVSSLPPAALANYSAYIVQRYKYPFAFTHNNISKELKDIPRPKLTNTQVS